MLGLKCACIKDQTDQSISFSTFSDMCPKPNSTDSRLSRNSHVEDFIERVPALFKSLTESPDALSRWDSMTYPVDYNFTHIGINKETKLMLRKLINL